MGPKLLPTLLLSLAASNPAAAQEADLEADLARIVKNDRHFLHLGDPLDLRGYAEEGRSAHANAPTLARAVTPEVRKSREELRRERLALYGQAPEAGDPGRREPLAPPAPTAPRATRAEPEAEPDANGLHGWAAVGALAVLSALAVRRLRG